jgi:hypothetical protein
MHDKPHNPGTPESAEYQHDLHPNFLAGENYGTEGPHADKQARSAYDIKELHSLLPGFDDSELRAIPILPEGSRLEQGATYLDLYDPRRGPFTAMGGMEAATYHFLVPKSEIGYVLWNKLVGVTDPERLDAGNDPR